MGKLETVENEHKSEADILEAKLRQMDAGEGKQTKSQSEASFVQTEAEVDDAEEGDDAEERDEDDEGDDELEDMGGAFDDDADATMGMGNGYEKYISGDFEKDAADDSKDKHTDSQETDKEDVSEEKDEANEEKEDQEGNTETQEEQVDQKEGANANLKAKLETVENEHKSEADILEAK